MVCRKIMTLVTNFSFHHHSLVIFLLFVEAAKKKKKKKKKDGKKVGILLNSIFIFGVYDYFVVRNIFLNQSKQSCFTIEALEEFQESFLVNCAFEALSWVSVYNRYVKLTLLRAGDTCCDVAVANRQTRGWFRLQSTECSACRKYLGIIRHELLSSHIVFLRSRQRIKRSSVVVG